MTDASSDIFAWPLRSYHGKRVLDVTLALIGLAITAPLFPLMAIAIRLTSPGPVFYRGRRAGLFGREFDQLKLRTMTADYAHRAAFTSRDDPRITGVSYLIRFIKLDELPQLINVLRGEMSIVGPRPEAAEVVQRCYDGDQLRVLSVRPGLTCLLQVRTYPDFTYQVPAGEDPQQYYLRVILPRRLREDLEYVDRMSLWLDLRIIIETIYCIGIKTWPILWQRRAARKAAARPESRHIEHS